MKTWTFKITVSLTKQQIKDGKKAPNASQIIETLRKKNPTIDIGCDCVLTPTFTIGELEEMGFLEKI